MGHDCILPVDKAKKYNCVVLVTAEKTLGRVGRYFFFSSPEPKAQGELIVWDSSRRPCVRPSVRSHFQT